MNELLIIQSRLKVGKPQMNRFGGYKYRSCEDILNAVKPLLVETECRLMISDDVLMVGDRYYVKAAVSLFDKDGKLLNSTFGWAREEECKKGMDPSQVTGASSSYARKYALNAMFLLDDVKDSDFTNQGENKSTQARIQCGGTDIQANRGTDKPAYNAGETDMPAERPVANAGESSTLPQASRLRPMESTATGTATAEKRGIPVSKLADLSPAMQSALSQCEVSIKEADSLEELVALWKVTDADMRENDYLKWLFKNRKEEIKAKMRKEGGNKSTQSRIKCGETDIQAERETDKPDAVPATQAVASPVTNAGESSTLPQASLHTLPQASRLRPTTPTPRQTATETATTERGNSQPATAERGNSQPATTERGNSQPATAERGNEPATEEEGVRYATSEALADVLDKPRSTMRVPVPGKNKGNTILTL